MQSYSLKEREKGEEKRKQDVGKQNEEEAGNFRYKLNPVETFSIAQENEMRALLCYRAFQQKVKVGACL